MKKFFVVLGVFVALISSVFSQEKEDVSTPDKKSVSNEQEQKKWPREMKIANAVITVFQPQLETFDNNKLTCRAAVSIKRKKREKTDYCAIWMKAVVDTDKATRVVKLRDLSITKIAYPGVSEKVKKSLGEIIRKHILKADLSISLDRLLAMLDVVEKQKKTDTKFDDNVPGFLFSKDPAVLVSIDGEPVMRDVGDGISQIANTRFLIALDSNNKKYYLQCAGRWFAAEKLSGPWATVSQVPEKIAALGNKDDSTEKTADSEDVPKIFVSMKPAVLIQSNGEPEVAKIPDTNLSYLKNSDSDVFRDDSTMKLYALASGRWFTADKKEGPWVYIASDKLPKDFSEIPENSPKSGILASVAGTQEAKDAVMESYIPQTATIKRGGVSLDIEYDGEPEFKPIDGTSMEYAVNTQTPVVKLNNKYYACDNGAWYESDSPKGKWDVCVTVPDEIYSIPPSCPIYNATFVKVYDSDDDSVDVGYTSGYDDSYVYGGAIVYGTGYCYRRWWRHHWWPRPETYGGRYRYNHHNGRWNRHDRYRDKRGRYVAWNNRKTPKTRPLPRRADGRYTGKQPVVRLHNAYKNNKGTMKIASKNRDIRKNVSKRPATSHRRVANNVYAGKDGKIYRHGLDGWQQRDRGKWQSTNPVKRHPKVNKPVIKPRPSRPVTRPRPTTRHRNLNRHYHSRQRGNHRSTRHRSYSRSRSFSSGRSRGGMSRGGRGGGGRGGRR